MFWYEDLSRLTIKVLRRYWTKIMYIVPKNEQHFTSKCYQDTTLEPPPKIAVSCKSLRSFIAFTDLEVCFP